MSESRSIHCDGAGCSKVKEPGEMWYRVEMRVELDRVQLPPRGQGLDDENRVVFARMDLCPGCINEFTRGCKILLKMPEGRANAQSGGEPKC